MGGGTDGREPARGDLSGRARSAAVLADTDLDRAALEARDILVVADEGDDATAVAECERILALAAVRAGDVGGAERHIRRSVALAERAGDRAALGVVLLTAMSVAATAGRFDEAIELCRRARPMLPPELALRADIQRATVLLVSSRVDDAIEAYRMILRDHPELGGLEGAVLRMNLGSQLVRRDDVSEGVDHLRLARADFLELGDVDDATACSLHVALAAARVGDHSTVFEVHRELEVAGALARTDPRTLLDLGDCLVAAGLVEEARRLVDRAWSILGAGPPSELSLKVELTSAGLLRQLGEHDASASTASDAISHATALGDDVAKALATIELLTTTGGANAADAARRLLDAADVCRRHGLDDAAVDAEIVAMGFVWALPLESRALVARLGSELEIRGSPIRRAQAHHHRALRSCCEGHHGAARRSLASGLRILERSRARLSAAELRAAASDRAPQMAALGLHLAVRGGRPDAMLEWAERLRATSLRFSDPPSAEHDLLRRDLAALRAASIEGPATSARVERRIVARQRSERSPAAVRSSMSAAEVRRALHSGATLLEYVLLHGRLNVLVVERRRASLTDLGVDVGDVEDALEKLLFGLRRCASASGPSVASALAMVEELSQRLGRWLVPPLPNDGGLVVLVPSGILHHMPWAAVPALSRRAFVVAPSASTWTVADAIADERDGVLAVSGPDLVEADAEIVDVAAAWPTAVALRRGTSTEVLEHLGDVGLVHLCCHGKFRTDSPQFSSMELADGPFTVLDLDGIGRLPSKVVLSACELGTVAVKPGDDILGFPAALFTRGVRTLVAAVVPVEDRSARVMMAAMHAAMAEGATPAEALRRARDEVRDGTAAHRAAAASFQCFGAG